jgi:hypothetical protein
MRIAFKYIASEFYSVMREKQGKIKPWYDYLKAVFNDLNEFNDTFSKLDMLAGDDRPKSKEIMVINPTMKE